MINIQKYNRWQAAATHFGLSVVIFTILLLLIIYIWYPGVFFHFGAMDGIKIVASVDLILGPTLTLIIFNKNKAVKLIAIDLAIIATIQFSALAVGIRIVYMERPVVQVLSDDGYVYIHTASEFKLAKMDTHFPSNPLFNVPSYYFKLPSNPILAKSFKLESEMDDKITYTLHKDRYITFENIEKDSLLKRLNTLSINKAKKCYMVEFESLHLFGKGCFSLKKGLVSINYE